MQLMNAKYFYKKPIVHEGQSYIAKITLDDYKHVVFLTNDTLTFYRRRRVEQTTRQHFAFLDDIVEKDVENLLDEFEIEDYDECYMSQNKDESWNVEFRVYKENVILGYYCCNGNKTYYEKPIQGRNN